jgi:hypothetical protein
MGMYFAPGRHLPRGLRVEVLGRRVEWAGRRLRVARLTNAVVVAWVRKVMDVLDPVKDERQERG